MGRFTEFEKKVIRAIVDLDRQKGFCVLANIWEGFFPDDYYLDVSDVTSPWLMIKSAALDGMDPLALQDLLNTLAQQCEMITSIFGFLEANQYLKLVGKYAIDSLGVVFGDESYAAYPLNVEPEVFQPVAVIAHRRILPAQGLYDFVENGFRTDDELKIERQARDNRVAFTCTLIGLFIAGLGLFITAVDGLKRWCESETRVVVVNGEKAGKPPMAIPVVLDGTTSSIVVSPSRGTATGVGSTTRSATSPPLLAPPNSTSTTQSAVIPSVVPASAPVSPP